MSFITRNVLRWGVIGGMGLVGLTFLVGPERVATGLSVVRMKAQSVVDGCVEDPVALRHQLERLADEYPDRIAEVRGELAEVDHQIAQFQRDIDVASRVVALATEDLQSLKTLVVRAEEEASMTVRPVSIRYEGTRYDIDEAYAEGRRINNVRTTYTDRLEQDKVQSQFLQEQQKHLADILAQLEEEYTTYQSQLWQLDRQIDAIERNERLIELTEQQQATLESYSRYGHVDNLKQIQGKLAELKARQQAQLETLSKKGIGRDYEKAAEYEMETGDTTDNPFDDPFEFTADEEGEDEEEIADRTVAFNSPIVIE